MLKATALSFGAMCMRTRRRCMSVHSPRCKTQKGERGEKSKSSCPMKYFLGAWEAQLLPYYTSPWLGQSPVLAQKHRPFAREKTRSHAPLCRLMRLNKLMAFASSESFGFGTTPKAPTCHGRCPAAGPHSCIGTCAPSRMICFNSKRTARCACSRKWHRSARLMPK